MMTKLKYFIKANWFQIIALAWMAWATTAILGVEESKASSYDVEEVKQSIEEVKSSVDDLKTMVEEDSNQKTFNSFIRDMRKK